MNHLSLLLFPLALTEARQSAMLSQKALALASGMDQSHVCGVEKGRRPTPKPDAVERMAAALFGRNDAASLNAFRWAAEHDRVVHGVATSDLAAAAELVSAVLQAWRCLKEDESAGLLRSIRCATESRKQLDQLERRGRATTSLEARVAQPGVAPGLPRQRPRVRAT